MKLMFTKKMTPLLKKCLLGEMVCFQHLMLMSVKNEVSITEVNDYFNDATYISVDNKYYPTSE